MRQRNVLLTGALCLGSAFVGYLLSHLFPVQDWKPVIKTTEITLNDYLTRRIQAIAAIATFLAAFIALFKEEIRRLWERAELAVGLKDDKQLQEVLDGETSGSAQGLRAHRYVSVMMVENKGTLPAKSCEAILERLSFRSDAFAGIQDIDVPGTILKWTNPSRDAIVIPGTGKSFLTLAEFLSPSSQPVVANEEATVVTYPSLIIGGATVPKEFINGSFTAVIKIYSENARPMEVSCSIKWTGRWQHRLTEMGQHVTVKISSKRL